MGPPVAVAVDDAVVLPSPFVFDWEGLEDFEVEPVVSVVVFAMVTLALAEPPRLMLSVLLDVETDVEFELDETGALVGIIFL